MAITTALDRTLPALLDRNLLSDFCPRLGAVGFGDGVANCAILYVWPQVFHFSVFNGRNGVIRVP